MKKIILIEDLISKEECQFLIDYYLAAETKVQWRDTFTRPLDFTNSFIYNIVNKVYSSFYKNYNLKFIPGWGEVVKWPEGSWQDRHLDNFENKKVSLTSITYLNDEYSGGETEILNNLIIKPKQGRTVVFDGSYYEHKVNKVTSKDRYTLPIWYIPAVV